MSRLVFGIAAPAPTTTVAGAAPHRGATGRHCNYGGAAAQWCHRPPPPPLVKLRWCTVMP